MSDDQELSIITGGDDALAHPYSYSDAVKELAFLCWFRSGRRVARAHRMLVEQCTAADADDALPLPSELPDESTMRRWVRRYDWPGQLADAVADHFPSISRRQAAELVMQSDDALSESAAILAGERDHLSGPALNARVALISLNLTLRGLGTAGARGGEPSIQANTGVAVDVSTMTPAELARYQRQQIEAGKKA